MTQKPRGLSQSKIAEAIGCSRSTVQRAVARGDIKPGKGGLFPPGAVDTLRALLSDSDDEEGEHQPGDLRERLARATARWKEAQADLRELQLAHESGRFVELAVVQQDGADTAERFVAVARAIPQRVAMRLECEHHSAAVVEAKIREEVERAIAELHESMFIKLKEERQ